MIKKKTILPEISVIVCAYNHDKWIERCIRSIKNQSIINKNDIEIIIVDDGSKDNTKKVISNLKNFLGIRIIKNKKNLGLPKSINIAIGCTAKLTSNRRVPIYNLSESERTMLEEDNDIKLTLQDLNEDKKDDSKVEDKKEDKP